MKTLTTERLRLTSWKLSDVFSLFEYARNPNVGEPAGWPAHENIFDSLKLIINVLIPQRVYCIRPRGTGQAIGTISLRPDKYRPGLRSMELGYSISEKFWGMGLMTEAVREMLRHGFEDMGLEMISVTTGTENEKSQRVIEKCGFTYEGTLRQAFLLWNNNVRDLMCYSITRDEYYENREFI